MSNILAQRPILRDRKGHTCVLYEASMSPVSQSHATLHTGNLSPLPDVRKIYSQYPVTRVWLGLSGIRKLQELYHRTFPSCPVPITMATENTWCLEMVSLSSLQGLTGLSCLQLEVLPLYSPFWAKRPTAFDPIVANL